ncbi:MULTISPECIES: hypothetical protein [Bradyrhizobium]|uniref:hypothetical protein n=1 Tax=Bradyrhizobium TaxID=374 RepID=UPI0004BC89EB|nr:MULTISPECIES: hypothetical protein [Bradyrhizobium]MBR0941785.1 hypothetical protein [Bradyrhizobium liaoningense]MDI2076052.1 hypothetical protein [Bradyrhizobium sp. Mp27]
MKKATVTYTAPKGEAKTLDIGGTTLFSGKADTVICDDALMARLEKAGGMLKVEGVSDYTPPKEAPKGDEPKETAKTEKDEHVGKAHR